jgi:hypothetical protein
MARKTGTFSKWAQMLTGASSMTFRRVFILALTVVSLTVWIVTVVGLGLLREDTGYPTAVRSAQAALPNGSAAPVTPAAPSPKATAAPATSDVAAVSLAAALPAVEKTAEGALPASVRDPFLASPQRFPLPVQTAKVGMLQESPPQKDNGPGLRREQLLPLRLEGTVILGEAPVAIVGGNSFEVEGRTMLVMLGDISGTYREGEKVIVVKDMTRHLKLGDTLEVRPVTVGEDRVRIHGDDEAAVLKVSGITDTSVELTLGAKTYVLRMKK